MTPPKSILDSWKAALEQALVTLASLAEKQRQSSMSIITSQLPPVKSRETPVTARDRLYNEAYKCLNTRLVLLAPQERGCAESVSRVIRRIYPTFPILLSTIDLNRALARSPQFVETFTPTIGTISIFPTQGSNIGHCGIWGKNYVMNNNSLTGKWDATYTLQGWYDEAKRRGLPLYFYNPL